MPEYVKVCREVFVNGYKAGYNDLLCKVTGQELENKIKETMSYCKKKGIEPTVCDCLACEYCLPPSERIDGRMCENEIDN